MPRPISCLARWSARAAVILALAGWWVSLDLLRLSSGAAATNPLLQAQCGDEKTSDCLSVLRSERAYLGLGQSSADPRQPAVRIPWSALGMAYFAFLAIWYLFVGASARSRFAWHLPIMLLVAFSALLSYDFINIMAGELKRWCAGCLAAHALNGGLVLATILAFPWRKPPMPVAAHPTPALALAALLAGTLQFFVHLAVTLLIIQSNGMTQMQNMYTAITGDPEYIRWNYNHQSAAAIPLRNDDVFDGPADAPNTVVAFVDFQCPRCRTAHERLAEEIKKRPGALRVVYRHFPQDSACNPFYEMRAHPAACRAAAAFEAARIVGGSAGASRMCDLLYERQTDLELDRFAAWAAELGLDAHAFAKAMNSPDVAARISVDAELGHFLGVKAVPIIFLNGKRLEGWHTPATWDILLNPPAATQPTTNPAPP